MKRRVRVKLTRNIIEEKIELIPNSFSKGMKAFTPIGRLRRRDVEGKGQVSLIPKITEHKGDEMVKYSFEKQND